MVVLLDLQSNDSRPECRWLRGLARFGTLRQKKRSERVRLDRRDDVQRRLL